MFSPPTVSILPESIDAVVSGIHLALVVIKTLKKEGLIGLRRDKNACKTIWM
jgi:hypothetical protein